MVLRYQYGEAFLIDCRIELMDSKESGYLYESRAVRVQWDNGKECCLVTSIPSNLFYASEVVKAYFDRWPYCEKQYALMKAPTCLYGKRAKNSRVSRVNGKFTMSMLNSTN